MYDESEEEIFDNDEIESGRETTEEINHTILDSRRRIERFFELKQLREILDEPDLEDLL